MKNNEYFVTWAIRIVINKSYDILKKNSKYSANEEYLELENLQTEDKYDDGVVTKSINALDEDLRAVTVMYYYDDISISDISKILEIPEGTVKSRLSRARGKLYELLKKEELV